MTNIPAGDLDQRVRYEQFVITGEDDFGKPIGAWETLFTRWAKVEIGGANEVTSQHAKTAVRTATVTIRRSEQLTEKVRMVWLGRTFNVSGVIDDNGPMMVHTATEQV